MRSIRNHWSTEPSPPQKAHAHHPLLKAPRPARHGELRESGGAARHAEAMAAAVVDVEFHGHAGFADSGVIVGTGRGQTIVIVDHDERRGSLLGDREVRLLTARISQHREIAFDPGWNAAVPYTVLIGIDGNVLYQKQGEIDPLEVRRLILANLPDDDYIGQDQAANFQ